MQTFTLRLRELPFKNYIYFSFGISVIAIVVIFALSSFLPPEVPLFYGKPVSEAQLTKTFGLSIAPLSSLIILAVNTLSAMLTKNTFVKKILIGGAFSASILAAITVAKIIFLVGFF